MSQLTYTTQGYYSQLIGTTPRTGAFAYKDFSKGLNIFSTHNEIRDDEFYEGENIMITGKGSIQMPRNGSVLFAKKNGATVYNGGGVFKDKTTNPPTNTPLFMFDGRLYKYSSGSLTEIDPSKTWDANAKIQGEMFWDYFYFCNGVDPLTKVNLTTVIKFIEIQKPSSITVTYTGSGNDYVYRYAVTVVTKTGETDAKESGDFWGKKSLDASNYFTISCPRNNDSNVVGYNVYRSINGSRLQFVQFIPQPASGNPQLQDVGLSSSPQYEAPVYNTTGGVKGRFIGVFKNTLFVAGVDDYPDILFFTGTGENPDSFSLDDNGGWIRVNYGDGERITALKNFDIYLLVIKQSRVFRLDFNEAGFVTLATAEALYGSPYPYSIDKFEKDLIMLGSDNRIRTLGYEPNLLNVIRTTDISNRIQSIIDEEFDLSNSDNIIGVYWKQKYILCDGKIAICYDRRYTGFHGKWTNYNYAGFLIYNDILLGIKNNGNIEKLLVDGVYEDNGSPIYAVFRPKTVDGQEDTLVKFFRYYKVKLKDFYGAFKLQTYLDGLTLEDERSIAIGGMTGIASSMWGQTMFAEGSGGVQTQTSALGTSKILTKEIFKEGYYFHIKFIINGNSENHLTIQSITGIYDYEDVDYYKNEEVIAIDI